MVDVAVLLAAGRGKRLGSLTAETPKPLLPVAGRPCLEWILRGLAGAGVKEAVAVTGYRAERLEAAFGSGEGVGLRLSYVRQENPNGTASAILAARDRVGNRSFLMSFGDILLHPANYAAALRRFRETGCDLLMAVNWVEDPWAGAAITLDGGNRVVEVVEKPPRGSSATHWNHAGLLVAKPVFFEYLAAVSPSPRGEYELTAAYPAMIRDGRVLVGLPVEGYWGDVGTPEDLERMSGILERESR